MPEERLSLDFSHGRKLRHIHIDQLVEWRRTFRTIASGSDNAHGRRHVDRSIATSR
jgi:hypothetical protein